MLAQTRQAVASTSAAVDTVETTSTSFMTAAGLKKCMPMTSAGREVAAAHSMTGSDEVVVASTAPGLQISSRSANSGLLDREVLDDGLDDQVARRPGRPATPAPVMRARVGVPVRLGRACRAATRLVQRPA